MVCCSIDENNLDFSQMQRLVNMNLVGSSSRSLVEYHLLCRKCSLTGRFFWIVFNLSIYTYKYLYVLLTFLARLQIFPFIVPLENHLKLYGVACSDMKSRGRKSPAIIWSHMRSFEITWDDTGSYVIIWSHVGWSHPRASEITWDHLKSPEMIQTRM